jgi:hypothetical protein
MCYILGVTRPAPTPVPAQDAGSDAVLTHAVCYSEVCNSEVYNSDGVELSLVRSMLAKTPTERLQAVQDVIDLLTSAKRAGPR